MGIGGVTPDWEYSADGVTPQSGVTLQPERTCGFNGTAPLTAKRTPTVRVRCGLLVIQGWAPACPALNQNGYGRQGQKPGGQMLGTRTQQATARRIRDLKTAGESSLVLVPFPEPPVNQSHLPMLEYAQTKQGQLA